MNLRRVGAGKSQKATIHSEGAGEELPRNPDFTFIFAISYSLQYLFREVT